MSDMSFIYFTEPLKDTVSFDNARKLLQNYASLLKKMANNETVSGLLDVIKEDNMLETMTKKQYAAILDALFRAEIKNDKIALMYMTKLDDILNGYAEKFHTNQRAEKYYFYVHDELLGNAKERKSSFFNTSKEEQVAILVDYLKLAVSLYHWAVQEHGEVPFEIQMSLETTKRLMEELFDNNLLQGKGIAKAKELFADHAGAVGAGVKQGARQAIRQAVQKQPQKPVKLVLGQVEKHADKIADFAVDFAKPVLEKGEKQLADKLDEINQYDEKKLYVVIVTWLLYLRICEEDKFMEDGERNE